MSLFSKNIAVFFRILSKQHPDILVSNNVRPILLFFWEQKYLNMKRFLGFWKNLKKKTEKNSEIHFYTNNIQVKIHWNNSNSIFISLITECWINSSTFLLFRIPLTMCKVLLMRLPVVFIKIKFQKSFSKTYKSIYFSEILSRN